MNIFVTSSCPVESAIYLDNKRVGKMLIESVQMLSTALILNGYDAPYKISHKNHPCNVWVRQSIQNYRWLYDHAYALGLEFYSRFGKTHKSFELLKTINMNPNLPNIGLTPFINCAANKSLGLDFKHIDDTTRAYREYLSKRLEMAKNAKITV